MKKNQTNIDSKLVKKLIILGAIPVVALLIFVYPKISNQRFNQDSAQKTITGIIPRDTSVSIAVTEDINLWKKYEAGGLSFKYPPEWKILTPSATNVLMISPDLLEPPKGSPLSVKLNDYKSYIDVLTDIRTILTDRQEKPISVNGRNGYEENGILNIPKLGMIKIFITILDINGHALNIEYAKYPDAENYHDVYQKVVASIKS